MRRVVVTGMGAVTPIGIGVDTFWENVKKKQNQCQNKQRNVC